MASVNNDLYGNTDIDVIVEDPTGLAPTVGSAVTITGKLATVDPLMRNLFVEDAVLS